MTLLAPRLLISLRREVYTHVPGVELGTVVVPGGVSNQCDRERILTWDVHDNSSCFELDEVNGETFWSIEAQYQLVSEGETIVADEVLQQHRNLLSTPKGRYTRVGSLSDFEARSEDGVNT